MAPNNLFKLQEKLPPEEYTEVLAAKPGMRIERIISSGQISPADFWYDQPEDEWVAVLQGKGILQWQDGSRQELFPGDWLLIPAHKKHRVDYTSAEPPCVWLAVFSGGGS